MRRKNFGMKPCLSCGGLHDPGDDHPLVPMEGQALRAFRRWYFREITKASLSGMHELNWPCFQHLQKPNPFPSL